MSESWLELLRAATERQSQMAVAEQLDVSRTMISLVLSGKYGKSTARLEKLVLAKLDRLNCPHLGVEISRQDCTGYHARAMPMSNPMRLRHWQACRNCSIRLAVGEISALEEVSA